MKTNTRMASGFTLVELLVVIAIIVTLAGVATPVLLGQRKKADHTKAIQNVKQIGYALFNFEGDFGRYPDTKTVDDLDSNAILASSGIGTANGFFSQLIAGGYVDQEGPFYCKTDFTVEPDNDKSSTGKILEAGEVGFSYVMRDSSMGLNSSVNSAIPIVVAPVSIDGTTYNRNVYNKKSVVLRIDLSASDPRIDDSGKIVMKGGTNIFEAAAGSVWEDSGISDPKVVHPDTGTTP